MYRRIKASFAIRHCLYSKKKNHIITILITRSPLSSPSSSPQQHQRHLDLRRAKQRRPTEIQQFLLRREGPQLQLLQGSLAQPLEGLHDLGEGSPRPPHVGSRDAHHAQGLPRWQEFYLCVGDGEVEEGHHSLQGGEAFVADLVVQDELEPECSR